MYNVAIWGMKMASHLYLVLWRARQSKMYKRKGKESEERRAKMAQRAKNRGKHCCRRGRSMPIYRAKCRYHINMTRAGQRPKRLIARPALRVGKAIRNVTWAARA